MKYTEIAFWKGVSLTDKSSNHDTVIHKWIVTVPGITKVGKEAFKFDPTFGLSHDIIRHMIEEKFFSNVSQDKPELTPRKHRRSS